MIEAVRISLALLLPWAAGVLWLRAVWGARSTGVMPVTLGYGYILGTFFTALLMLLVDTVGLRQSFWPVAGALALVCLAGAFFRRKPEATADSLPSNFDDSTKGPLWKKAVILMLIGLLAMGFVESALEILWRPLYPWDAWATWVPRVRMWFEYGYLHPPEEDCLADGFFSTSHPISVSLVHLWMVLSLGRWDDSLINLPWLFCMLGLALGFYGQLRIWGIGGLAALSLVWILRSMPLLDAHVALAGYADLWLATAFGMAGMALCQWLRNKDWIQGLLALLMALVCVLIKNPGIGWVATLVPPLLVGVLVEGVPRHRVGVFLGLPAVLLSMLLAGHAGLLGKGLSNALTKALEQFVSGDFHPVWQAFRTHFLVYDNWHLLWYGIVIYLLTIPYQLRYPGVQRHVAVLVLCVCGYLGAVFFLTDQHVFASNSLKINRAALHAAPLLLFCMAVTVPGFLGRLHQTGQGRIKQDGNAL